MKYKVLATLGLTALLAGPALAGLDPANPGLPSVTDAAFGAAVVNNQISAMCVDCHTVAPKPAPAGSHYVNTLAGGETNSGGSGINAAGAIAARDDGAYFKITLWDAAGAGGMSWPSKYGNAYVSTVNQLPTGVTSMNATVAAITGGMDLICESCHNIVGNEDGGNNLLEVQPGNEWEDTSTAELCVGCHGFMYSNDATVLASHAGDANVGDGRNANEVSGGNKGNNEYHWVQGTAYPQSHHVMTGDNISAAKATAAALWTDNLIIAYADHATDNTYAGGTLPQRAAWVNLNKPTAAGDLSCTSCHTPAHGFNASPAASILRNATYTTLGNDQPGQIDRISDRGAWKRIDDLTYCAQCHIN